MVKEIKEKNKRIRSIVMPLIALSVAFCGNMFCGNMLCGKMFSGDAHPGCALAANTQDSSLKQQLNAADGLFEFNNLDEALRKCNSILHSDKNNLGALVLRSMIYMNKHEIDKATVDEKAALSLSPKTPLDEYLLTKYLRRRGRFENALTHIQKAIELDPHDPRFYCQLSYLHSDQHTYSAALKDTEKALQADPHCLEAVVSRSRIRRATGQYAASIADMDQVIKVAPTGNNNLDRGLSKVRLQRFADALPDYSQAIALDPSPLAFSGRAACYLNLGQTDKALPDLDQSIARDPGFVPPRKLKVQAYLSIKQPEKALKTLNAFVNQIKYLNQQDNEELHQLRYQVHEQMKDWNAAVMDLEDYIREFPKNTWAPPRLSRAKQFASAAKVHNSEMAATGPGATKSTAASPARDVQVHLGLARSSYKDLEFKTAIGEYDKVIAADPHSFDAFIERGRAYHEINQIAKAEGDFDTAARLDPKSDLPYVALAKLYHVEKQYDLSLKNWSKAIALSNDERSLTERAELYLLTGKKKESLADSEMALKLNSRFAPAMVARANAYVALGQPAKALPDLDYVIGLSPDDRKYLVIRAAVYEKLGRANKAAEDRKAAQEFDKHLFNTAPFRMEKN